MAYRLLLILFIFSIININAQSVSTTAGSAVVVATGNDTWSNPANATGAGDNVYTKVNNMDDWQESHQLNLSNFGLSIPNGSTITGVEVTVEWYAQHGNRVDDEHIFLIDETGTVAGSDRSTNSNLTTTENQRTFGSNSDLWGLALTEAIVEDPDFGCSIVIRKRHSSGGNYDAWIDFVQITVYYSAPITLVNGPGSGNTLDFDGNNDYVEISSTFPNMGSQDFTVTAWIKPDDITTGGQRIWCDDETDANGGYALSLGDPGSGRLRFFTRGLSPVSLDVGAANAMSNGTWYHVAMVHDATAKTKSIYIDGVQVASGTYTGNLVNSPGNCTIAGETDASSESGFKFDGRIDEVSFWTTALTQTDLRDNMCKKLIGSEANLIGYWRFDESSGTVLADHSNSYHGQLKHMVHASDWIYSGAPLGNTSTYLYTGSWAGQNIFLQSPEGDSLQVSSVTGSPDGVHVYHVNELPNDGTGIVGGGLNDHYFGVFNTGGAAPTYTGTYFYRENDAYQAGAIEAGMMTYKRDDNADLTWVSSVATLNTSLKSLTMAARNTEIFLGNSLTPLPIELISFEVNTNENKVEIRWITLTEVNNDYFTIERSVDGVNWDKVIVTNGAGSSKQVLEYFELDHNPLTGISYYRLKQTDFDGEFSYSNIVPIRFFKSFNDKINLFPSPIKAGEVVNIKFNKVTNSKTLIVIFDIQGKELYSISFPTIPDKTPIRIPINYSLQSGTYFMRIVSGNQIFNQKLIIKNN